MYLLLLQQSQEANGDPAGVRPPPSPDDVTSDTSNLTSLVCGKLQHFLVAVFLSAKQNKHMNKCSLIHSSTCSHDLDHHL